VQDNHQAKKVGHETLRPQITLGASFSCTRMFPPVFRAKWLSSRLFVFLASSKDSISQICFPSRVILSKLASRTATQTIGGDRPGVKWVVTSKPSTSTCLTLPLEREGWVESNRYHSYGNATDIVATRFVPNEYSSNRSMIGAWVKTMLNVFTHVAGASWVLTLNCVCNSRFNPSSCFFSTLC